MVTFLTKFQASTLSNWSPRRPNSKFPVFEIHRIASNFWMEEDFAMQQTGDARPNIFLAFLQISSVNVKKWSYSDRNISKNQAKIGYPDRFWVINRQPDRISKNAKKRLEMPLWRNYIPNFSSLGSVENFLQPPTEKKNWHVTGVSTISGLLRSPHCKLLKCLHEEVIFESRNCIMSCESQW